MSLAWWLELSSWREIKASSKTVCSEGVWSFDIKMSTLTLSLVDSDQYWLRLPRLTNILIYGKYTYAVSIIVQWLKSFTIRTRMVTHQIGPYSNQEVTAGRAKTGELLLRKMLRSWRIWKYDEEDMKVKYNLWNTDTDYLSVNKT